MSKVEYINWNAGTYPWFQDLLKKRIHKGFNTILLFCGGAGIGKSYGALTLGEELDPTFNIDRVTFFPAEFIRQTQIMKRGEYIMIDEPAIAGVLGKRTWYTDMQQALVDVLETFRFKNLTCVFCSINRNLLDSIVRTYLLHYMVIMLDRGFGKVYSFDPSQFDSQVRTPLEGEIYLEQASQELREAYEAKRKEIQNSRYFKSLSNIETKESKRKSFNELVVEAQERESEVCGEGNKWTIPLIRQTFGVGQNQARDMMHALYPPRSPPS